MAATIFYAMQLFFFMPHEYNQGLGALAKDKM
jgi:hypothetical protein